MTIDVHQHLWPDPFLAALRARRTAPRLDGWMLHLPGERPYAVDPAAPRPGRARRAGRRRRRRTASSWPRPRRSGLDRLPPAEAAELAEAWLEGALALPAPFSAWAMAGDAPRPTRARCATALDRGAVGLELAADRARRPGRARPPRAAARRARRRRPPAARPPRPRRRAGRARPPGLVGARRPLRRPAARRLVGVGRRRPRALSRTSRSASSRSPASARSTASASAPAAARAGRSTRSRSSRRRRTARRRSTP